MLEQTDLSTCTTAELIEELKRRSRAMVFGFDPLADKSLFTIIRHGSKLTVSGLLRVLTIDSDNDFTNDPRDKSDKKS